MLQITIKITVLDTLKIQFYFLKVLFYNQPWIIFPKNLGRSCEAEDMIRPIRKYEEKFPKFSIAAYESNSGAVAFFGNSCLQKTIPLPIQFFKYARVYDM